MDPLTIAVAFAIGSFFFFKKKKHTTRQPANSGVVRFTVSDRTPPTINEVGSTTATVPSDATVVLSLPSAWRGTVSYQGVVWEDQGSPDGPDFMFRRDPDWSGDANFAVVVRNSYGQTVGNVVVKFA